MKHVFFIYAFRKTTLLWAEIGDDADRHTARERIIAGRIVPFSDRWRLTDHACCFAGVIWHLAIDAIPTPSSLAICDWPSSRQRVVRSSARSRQNKAHIVRLWNILADRGVTYAATPWYVVRCKVYSRFGTGWGSQSLRRLVFLLVLSLFKIPKSLSIRVSLLGSTVITISSHFLSFNLCPMHVMLCHRWKKGRRHASPILPTDVCCSFHLWSFPIFYAMDPSCSEFIYGPSTR